MSATIRLYGVFYHFKKIPETSLRIHLPGGGVIGGGEPGGGVAFTTQCEFECNVLTWLHKDAQTLWVMFCRSGSAFTVTVVIIIDVAATKITAAVIANRFLYIALIQIPDLNSLLLQKTMLLVGNYLNLVV
jgi:hypothetical protein